VREKMRDRFDSALVRFMLSVAVGGLRILIVTIFVV
jgi:hypothetical protein